MYYLMEIFTITLTEKESKVKIKFYLFILVVLLVFFMYLSNFIIFHFIISMFVAVFVFVSHLFAHHLIMVLISICYFSLKQNTTISRILLRNLYVFISSPTIFLLYTKYSCALSIQLLLLYSWSYIIMCCYYSINYVDIDFRIEGVQQ